MRRVIILIYIIFITGCDTNHQYNPNKDCRIKFFVCVLGPKTNNVDNENCQKFNEERKMKESEKPEKVEPEDQSVLIKK